jgi:ankyrin repeat protein
VAERAALVPNALFAAVYDNSLADTRALSLNQPALLDEQDKNGDTPLAIALRLGYREIAQQLLSRTPAEHLTHQNHEGESYVFLAAATNQAELIQTMADAAYGALGSLQRYHFFDLDLANRAGQRALFVAADRVVAETLERQYYRGLLQYPWWRFMMKTDHNRRTFLHTAAAAGRADLLAWAGERLCSNSSWQDSQHFFFHYPAEVLSVVVHGLQTYFGELGLWTDVLVNRQDDNGDTALHAAVAARQWSSMRALASCQWLDYDLKNHRGELALHTLLRALSGHDLPAAAADRQAFDFLLAQDTHLRKVVKTPTDRINARDVDGNSTLHLAARLNDPYFYQELARRGDVYAVNQQGVTPQSLFQRHRQTIENSGQ